MAIPFKSSITLGQIFAQNNDFRILTGGANKLSITNNSTLLSNTSVTISGSSSLSLTSSGSWSATSGYGGSLNLGSSSTSFSRGQQILSFATQGVQLSSNGAPITITTSSYGTIRMDATPQLTISSGHYGQNITINDTNGIIINNSNYSSRSTGLYLGPLNIANDNDKTITNRYSTDNDTGVYAPEPTYGDIYSWDVNKKFNIATTGWVLDRIAAWQRIQVMELSNTNAYSNTLSGNVSSDYYSRTWCFLINVYHRPAEVWYCAPISVQPFPNTTAKSEVYVNGSKKVVTLTVGSGTNITVSINDNSQTGREYNYNLLSSKGFCI